VSTAPDLSTAADSPPDNGRLQGSLLTAASPSEDFRLALAIYIGWSILAWLSHIAGTVAITSQTATILLLGIGTTNALFFMISRSNLLHRPPTDTLALAQAVVGIAWTTLFAAMSVGNGELIIGLYASIVLFAILRVSHNALTQLAVFALISYTIISIIKTLSTDTPPLSPATLVQVLIFAAVMLCVIIAGRYVYRQHGRLKAEFSQLQKKSNGEPPAIDTNSVGRRYILDLLAREKGRTDRSNVPFCVCVFNADHVEKSADSMHDHRKRATMKTVEAIMREELRAMDSLNATGFHECFGPYSDKEYIAILPQTNLHGAQRSVERTLAAVATQYDATDNNVRLYGGIAEYQRGEAISDLLARAEDALGRARASGISRVCHSEQPAAHYADVVRLETRRT